MHPKIGRSVLAAAILAYLAAAVFPGTINPPWPRSNGIEVADDGVWRIRRPAVARTEAAPSWLRDAIESRSFGVDLRLRPAHDRLRGPARIFTISANFRERDVTLGQDGSALVLRLRRPGSNANGSPDYRFENALPTGEWRRIRLEIHGAHVALRADDALLLETTCDGPVTPTWNPTYRLALGNEVVMNRCWEGDLSAAQVHVAGRAIDLLRSPELYRPERFPLLRTIGDQFEARYLVRTAPRDAVLNFFCFIPLGWLVVLVLPGIRLGPATALGFATSLAMETLQLLCPDRYPSLVDLALNAAGTAAGFALATRFARWRARESAAA